MWFPSVFFSFLFLLSRLVTHSRNPLLCLTLLFFFGCDPFILFLTSLLYHSISWSFCSIFMTFIPWTGITSLLFTPFTKNKIRCRHWSGRKWKVTLFTFPTSILFFPILRLLWLAMWLLWFTVIIYGWNTVCFLSLECAYKYYFRVICDLSVTLKC